MSDWILDHGVWRWRGPNGMYYRCNFQGGHWVARINRLRDFPKTLGTYPTANEAKTACAEHAREVTA